MAKCEGTSDVWVDVTCDRGRRTRGERLALTRSRLEPRPRGDSSDALNIVEINAEDRIVAGVVFDIDDFDAAIAELDARYLAGEAAAHAHTWSLVVGAYAAINRHELAETTPDLVNIDHRRGRAFAPGDLPHTSATAWDLTQDIARNRGCASPEQPRSGLSPTAHGTSQEGFDGRVAEIRS